MNRRPIVIVGTGLGGYSLARELRKLDAETPVLILTADGFALAGEAVADKNALTRELPPTLP